MRGDRVKVGDWWMSPAFLAGVLLLGTWPIGVWYAKRMSDGADEPLGVLALAAALWFAFRGSSVEMKRLGESESGGLAPPSDAKRRMVVRGLWTRLLGLIGFTLRRSLLEPIGKAKLWGALLVLGVYSYFDDRISLLVSAGFVVLILAILLGRREGWLGHWGLFALSLPLIASLQFYGGYPIRLLVGKVCSLLLGAVGVAVEVEGTALHWRGETILIDAPCSGIQMLWAAAFFSCLIICRWQMNTWSSLRLLQFSGAVIFGANVARNFSLFFLETEIIRAPEWGHSGVGLLWFGLALWAIWRFALRLNAKRRGDTDLDSSRSVEMGRDWVLEN